MIESDHESSLETKRRPTEASPSLRRMGKFITRRRFSEEDKIKLEEVSREKLLDQINSSAPDEVTIPSRLLKND